MKYPYTSMLIGQIVMNQPITWELWENYQDEYKKCKKEDNYWNLYGTKDFWGFLMELSGCGVSVNTIGRHYALGIIATAIDYFLDKTREANFPPLDAEYPLDPKVYIPNETSFIRVGKDGLTFGKRDENGNYTQQKP